MSRSEVKRVAIQKDYDVDVDVLSDGRFLVKGSNPRTNQMCAAAGTNLEECYRRVIGGLDKAQFGVM